MSGKNLESLIQSAGNPATMLRNSQIGAYVYPVVPNEYSNWRDEQKAWRDTAVLFDQSHHMVNVYIEGPDALKLVSHLAFNSFASFPVDRAKHFAPCSYDGYIIGDGILFHLAPNQLVYVGARPPQAGSNSMRPPAASTSRPRRTTVRPAIPAARP